MSLNLKGDITVLSFHLTCDDLLQVVTMRTTLRVTWWPWKKRYGWYGDLELNVMGNILTLKWRNFCRRMHFPLSVRTVSTGSYGWTNDPLSRKRVRQRTNANKPLTDRLTKIGQFANTAHWYNRRVAILILVRESNNVRRDGWQEKKDDDEVAGATCSWYRRVKW